MMKNSCKGCDHRKVGCHSICEEYKAYKEEWAKTKEKMDKEHKSYLEYMRYVNSQAGKRR